MGSPDAYEHGDQDLADVKGRINLEGLRINIKKTNAPSVPEGEFQFDLGSRLTQKELSSSDFDFCGLDKSGDVLRAYSGDYTMYALDIPPSISMLYALNKTEKLWGLYREPVLNQRGQYLFHSTVHTGWNTNYEVDVSKLTKNGPIEIRGTPYCIAHIRGVSNSLKFYCDSATSPFTTIQLNISTAIPNQKPAATEPFFIAIPQGTRRVRYECRNVMLWINGFRAVTPEAAAKP